MAWEKDMFKIGWPDHLDQQRFKLEKKWVKFSEYMVVCVTTVQDIDANT